jgi:hypothetical protein
MLQRIIGNITPPEWAQITWSYDRATGVLTVHFNARQEGHEPYVVQQTYKTQIVPAKAVTDILAWLKAAAEHFKR